MVSASDTSSENVVEEISDNPREKQEAVSSVDARLDASSSFSR
jgi:hypothetical protein